jgi:hypothetical protein
LNVIWKIKGSTGNQNIFIQNEGCAMFFNEVMKKTQKNRVWKLKKIKFPKI